MEAVERAKVAPDGAQRAPHRLAATSLRILPDERLAKLAADGNQAAFAAIYERHHQALYRYCRTITRDDEDARDALQATMLKAMKAIDTKPTKVRAWLYRIAHNESISILRSGKRHSTDSLDDVEPSAEAPLESRRELRELLDDIGHLSDRQRQALVMRELGGLSYEEVGAALTCSPAAAKQAAFDARTALHELAEARDTDCESIRKRISDGDRRMLRARGVRAHLRGCDPCRRFDAALQTRQAKLAGLVPVLSPAASAAILQSVLGGGAATGAAAGAATLGGGAGAAAIGTGAAATATGGAIGGGIAMKGVVAGIAALVATGGAIAIKEERDANRNGGSNGGAVEVREATDAAAIDRAGATAGTANAGAGATTESAGAETSGEANGNGTANAGAGDKPQNGEANHSGTVDAQHDGQTQGDQNAPPQGQHPQGTQPQGQHPGGNPSGTGTYPQPGGQRPPRPPAGGGATGGGGGGPPLGGSGTRPPTGGGGTQPGFGGGGGGGGSTGIRPPGSYPPPQGGATTESQRPPRPQGTHGTAAVIE